MIFPSTGELSVRVVSQSDVALKDVKAAKVIWGCSVLKMKGNTVRRNGKKVVHSLIKVPTELIKLHQYVELRIDVFCQQTHLFHNLQHKDMLLYGHSFGIL
jgi:hypothetical protein